MTIEQTIDKILSQHSGISKTEIVERLEKEKKKTGSLISDATLLRIIAAELGLNVQNSEVASPALSVVDLVPSLHDVTVVGRILAVFRPKTFNRTKEGKFASLLIADETDILRVVLWNDKTRLIESEELKVGQILRVLHGYTKEGRGGKVELHMGEKSHVEINPENVEANDYPTIDKFTIRIEEIVRCHKGKVNVTGTVKNVFRASTFERQDLTLGKVMRLILADETGEVPVVVWNEKADELEKMLEKDAKLQIVDAKVRKIVGEHFEIHVDAGTYVEILPADDRLLRTADI